MKDLAEVMREWAIENWFILMGLISVVGIWSAVFFAFKK